MILETSLCSVHLETLERSSTLESTLVLCHREMCVLTHQKTQSALMPSVKISSIRSSLKLVWAEVILPTILQILRFSTVQNQSSKVMGAPVKGLFFIYSTPAYNPKIYSSRNIKIFLSLLALVFSLLLSFSLSSTF